MNKYPSVKLELPNWVSEEVARFGNYFPTKYEKMRLAIRLSERNVIEGTGGPFGACIFEVDSGKLIAPGVNIVVSSNCSVAHAEAMAIITAEQVLTNFDLGANGRPKMELVTSAQPCTQCFGMLQWCGVVRVIYGATSEDVEELTGFQEGILPENWDKKLHDRYPLEPILVVKDVLREEAQAVLKLYRDTGGFIYNPFSDTHDSHEELEDTADVFTTERAKEVELA